MDGNQRPLHEMQKFHSAFRGLWESLTIFAQNKEVIFEGLRSNHPHYNYTWIERVVRIQYSYSHFVGLFKTLDRIFPNQLSISGVQALTLEILLTHFEAEGPNGNIHPIVMRTSDINALASRVYRETSSTIQEYQITVPLWGLETAPNFSLPIYDGQLFRSPNSSINPNFSMLWKLDRKLPPEDRNYLYGIVFYEFSAIGDQEYLHQNAIERASFVIQMLRLYLASASDKHSMSIPPELRLPQIDQVPFEKVYLQAIGDGKLPVMRMRPHHHNPFHVRSTEDLVNTLNSKSFAELNTRLEPLANTTEMSERLKEAVKWFGRGIASDEITDSFMFYAISAEAILSTGNNSQDDYARCMARLIKKAIDDRPFFESSISSRFSKHVNQRDSQGHIPFFEKRTKELFAIRNDIAHGSYRERDSRDILSDLIDIEDFVRVAIFTIASSTWEALSELRRWAESIP